MPTAEQQPHHTQDPLLAVLSRHRARQYVAGIPAAVSGQGGHKHTFSVALTLVHGFALAPADAWPILEAYNARCEPPWTTAELRHKLRDALRVSQLPPPSRPDPPSLHASAGEQDPTCSAAGPIAAQARANPAPLPLQRARGHLFTGSHSLRIIRPNTATPPRHQGPSLGTIRLLDADLAPEPTVPSAKDANLGAESSAFDVCPSPSALASRHSSGEVPAILDPPSSFLGSLRPGPTIQLPRAGEGIIDPRTDPEREWIHIQGYTSVPPKNCLVCWIERSRSLWIGMCLCGRKMQPDP